MRWSSWPLATKLALAMTILVVLVVVSITLLWIRYEQRVFQVQDVSNVRNLGIGVALAATAVGVLLALLVSRSVKKPLREIERTVGWLASGDLSRQIPLYDRGDLADLSQSLNEMVVRLQQVAEHRGAIVEAIYEGILIVNHKGQIIELNPAASRMFGYRRSLASELSLGELITVHNPQPGSDRQMGSYLQGGEGSLFGQMIEAVAHRADGSEFPVEWAITRISATQPPMFTIVVHDLSERKRAEEEIRQAKDRAEAASRAKSTFLANMSHELRTPLSAIIGYSELLQEDALERGYSHLVPDLERIQTAGRQLLMLISGILDLSKIEAGKLELHLEEFDLRELIDDVVTTSRPLVVKNDNALQVDCPDRVGVMVADRTKVQQVLLNLLNNAAKFTMGGTITLRVARETTNGSEWVCFWVSDTGIGMTEQQMKNLFQPFTQVDASIAKEYGGSGLGLAIGESFCRLMGGEISVESKQGKGSTFSVRLPAVVVPKSPVEGVDPRRPVPPVPADARYDGPLR